MPEVFHGHLHRGEPRLLLTTDVRSDETRRCYDGLLVRGLYARTEGPLATVRKTSEEADLALVRGTMNHSHA